MSAPTRVDALDREAVGVGPDRLDDETRRRRAGRDRVRRMAVIERCEDRLQRLTVRVPVTAVRVAGR
jgi:hypothetical protein